MPDSNVRSAFSGMRRSAATGLVVVMLFFGGFGGWAVVAPLESAALASGELIVEGNRKTVQHLEGGIVARIVVKEGETVDAGQLLIALDRTQALANLEQLKFRYHAALARRARLKAERDGATEFDFDAPGAAAGSRIELEDAIASERSIFAARQSAIDGQAAILRQRIAQFENEIVGLEGEIAADRKQLQLIAQELRGQESLVKRKLTGTQRQIELKREAARIEGARSRNTATVARVKQNIAEERLKILELSTQRTQEVVAELSDNQTLLSDLRERIRAAADVVSRTHIKAPITGVIVDLKLHTVGGVIQPGDALMDIVPLDERLLVQARVSPEDIDNVHPGLTAQVVLTAFNRRNVQPLSGDVLSVSADRLTDQRSGLPYFTARIAVPNNAYADSHDVSLYPGMQAEVMIVTGERTPLEYLLAPLVQSFQRALRED